MTNLYVPLQAHKLSAAVGSGKTRAAIQWLADPKNAAKNVLYVAPTQALINQTAEDLRAAIAATDGKCVRNVNLIHAGTAAQGCVQAEALEAIRQVEEVEGAVQLITTQTFLAIVSRLPHPERWGVILDEAFEPASFTTFRLGTDAKRGWEHFSELFTVDGTQGHRIVPRPGKRVMVEEVARNFYSTAGDRFRALQPVAVAVANPAVRCELVMTDGAAALVTGTAHKKRTKKTAGKVDQPESTALQFASYVDPSAFAGFREVLFLSALFEATVLYHLWTKALGVTFEEHPEFPSHLLRDTHKEQGRFLAVGHLLNKQDLASMENLQRDIWTGEDGARQGARVIDHLVTTAAAHFGGEQFLLQSNARYGYVPGAPVVPRSAVVIPTKAHGLNSFQAVHNVAALAVTNPNTQQREWIKDRTGMTSGEITQAFRIPTVYQALGRCSIRRAQVCPDAKVVLVAGYEDARFILDLFPGSHWLGQVGTLPSLTGLRQQETTKEPGKVEVLAQAIGDHLSSLPDEVLEVTSRQLKGLIDGSRERSRKCSSSPLAIGANEQFQTIDRNQWQRAVSLACVSRGGWQKRGHSLHRVTAQLYGFAS